MKFRSDASNLVTIGLAVVGMGFLQSAHAFFRMPCSQPVVVERSDPIVNPGAISGHLHTIMGSSGFNFTANPDPASAKCTSCKVRQSYGKSSSMAFTDLFFSQMCFICNVWYTTYRTFSRLRRTTPIIGSPRSFIRPRTAPFTV